MLQSMGLITGSGGSLMEEKLLNRAEFMTIIARLNPEEFKQYKPPTKATFVDVPVNHWAFKYVEYGYSKGITNGIGNQRFGVSNFVNYNQASILLVKTLGYDISNIKYESAAYEISKYFGINLIEDIKPSESIKRIHMFELLAKTLVTKSNNGDYLIDKMGYLESNVSDYVDMFYEVYNTYLIYDLENGLKEVRYSNGDVYIGSLLNGLKNGYGMCYFANGDYYVGEFLNDQVNGTGTLVYDNGEKLNGRWENNSYIGETVSDNTTSSLIQNYQINFVDNNYLPVENLNVNLIVSKNARVYNLFTDNLGNIYFPIEGDSTSLTISINETNPYVFEYVNTKLTATFLYKANPD